MLVICGVVILFLVLKDKWRLDKQYYDYMSRPKNNKEREYTYARYYYLQSQKSDEKNWLYPEWPYDYDAKIRARIKVYEEGYLPSNYFEGTEMPSKEKFTPLYRWSLSYSPSAYFECFLDKELWKELNNEQDEKGKNSQLIRENQ